MDTTVFQKMRIKPGTSGRHFYAPESYITMIKNQNLIDFKADNPLFFHLFVTSQEEYDARIQEVLSQMMHPQSRLWISYRKRQKTIAYNINRDSFFELGKRDGLVPFSNVALDEEWSCIGFKKAHQ